MAMIAFIYYTNDIIYTPKNVRDKLDFLSDYYGITTVITIGDKLLSDFIKDWCYSSKVKYFAYDKVMEKHWRDYSKTNKCKIEPIFNMRIAVRNLILYNSKPDVFLSFSPIGNEDKNYLTTNLGKDRVKVIPIDEYQQV